MRGGSAYTLVGVSWIAASAVGAEPKLTAAREMPERRHLVYVEGFGKAGVYGAGWELAITPRLALGIASSFAMLNGHQLYTTAPYVHGTLLGRRRHAMFCELGLAVVHSRLVSPVPEWDGMTDTGAGGQAALGWQYQPGRFVLRTSGGVALGEGGAAPYFGLAVGARL